jgi:hydrogenase nickel incorporation protein HypA/HybF
MHELPVTESILEITLRHARGANAVGVTDVYLVIGQLSSIIDDSVQFYWDMISEGTIAEGASLHFKRVQAELLCRSCGESYRIEGEQLACQRCGSSQIEIVAGREFYVDSIDVETEQEGESTEK